MNLEQSDIVNSLCLEIIIYRPFSFSWCDVLQDFINLINVDVDSVMILLQKE